MRKAAENSYKKKKDTFPKKYRGFLKGSKRYRTLQSLCRLLFLLLLLMVFLGTIIFFMRCGRKSPSIPANCNETEEFRRMNLSKELIACVERLEGQTNDDRYRILALLMASSGFLAEKDRGKLPCSLEEYDKQKAYYESRQSEELHILEQSYQTILSDLVYFPVMKSSRVEGLGVSYVDSWFAERAYQDTKHAHEGTDIMALNNERGYYPIVSMTDGVVENLGWLEKGGYRVGVRSPHGAYIYYAHLYRYAEGLEKGDTVKAGQLLGFMGDSGYSKVEGTVGKFDVHLHLGIYLKTEHFEEISVNPYYILKLIEKNVCTGEY